MGSHRVLLAGTLLICASTLPALAHASPPDSSWTPAIYDEADFDDVVTLVVSGIGKILPDLPEAPRFIPGRVETLTFVEAAPEMPGAPDRHSRAPPLS
jgi:hypothetical protein